MSVLLIYFAVSLSVLGLRHRQVQASPHLFSIPGGLVVPITNFYHGFATGDLTKRIEVLMLLTQTNPRDRTAHTDLALTHIQMGQFDEAIVQAREATSNNPNFAPAHRALAWALLCLNRFAEARDVITQAIERKLDIPVFHTFLYQMALISDDKAGMQQQLDWARRKANEDLAFSWQTAAAASSGQWRKAQELSRRTITLADHGDTKEVAALYAAEQALRLSVLSSHSGLDAPERRKLKLELQNLAQTALNLARGRASLPRAALALALCGQTDQAKPLVDELTKRYPEDTVIQSIWLPVIRAAIDLRRRNPAGAVERLQTASRYEGAAEFWPQYLRGQAHLNLQQGTEAAAEFRKIVDHRGQAPLSMLYPLAHLGLARAASLAGNLAESRSAYENFFSIWKSADPKLPILVQARGEYRRSKR